MKTEITIGYLKKLLADPEDRIEPGSTIFDRLVDQAIDPCVASIDFGGFLRMHVTRGHGFIIGSAQCAMSRAALDACFRARNLIVKANLVDIRGAKR
jgi:hypothetical protein